MNDTSEQTLDEQQNLAHMVEELLDERQELLVGFCRVAGIESNPGEDERRELLQRFCSLLMDYSALWHFEVFEYLQKREEIFPNAMDAAKKFEQRIVRASESAVDFNDKYDVDPKDIDMQQLDGDLSQIGEALAARVEAEDCILNAMIID